MCEKCWRDAYHYDGVADSQAERYAQLVAEREASGNACSLREQAGEWWDEARGRDSRLPPGVYSVSRRVGDTGGSA